MRALVRLTILSVVGACTSANVQPLVEFGPMEAYVDVELGPLSSEVGRDVNPRVFGEFFHTNPDCPVFDDGIDLSIDGVRPSSLEVGYYDEGGGYGHDTGASCQSPYFSIDRVPAERQLSTLRLADSTASYSVEVDRLFVNPALTIATPLVRGQLARIDVADDRQITMVDAYWMMGDAESSIGYPLTAIVSATGISFRMPTEVNGPGWLELRVQLPAPQVTCNGFSACAVNIKGSAKLDATLE